MRLSQGAAIRIFIFICASLCLDAGALRAEATAAAPSGYALTVHYPDGVTKKWPNVESHQIVSEKGAVFLSVILKDGRRRNEIILRETSQPGAVEGIGGGEQSLTRQHGFASHSHFQICGVDVKDRIGDGSGSAQVDGKNAVGDGDVVLGFGPKLAGSVGACDDLKNHVETPRPGVAAGVSEPALETQESG